MGPEAEEFDYLSPALTKKSKEAVKPAPKAAPETSLSATPEATTEEKQDDNLGYLSSTGKTPAPDYSQLIADAKRDANLWAGGELGALAGAAGPVIRGIGPFAKEQLADVFGMALKKMPGFASSVNPQNLTTTSPTTPSASTIENTDAQIARILQGGEGSTEGTTGRARHTGYQIETAQQAAAKEMADEISKLMRRTGMSEFDARQFLAKQPGLTASPAGIIYPRSESRPTIGARTYKAAPVNAQASQTGIPTVGSEEIPVIGGANASVQPAKSPLPTTTAPAPVTSSFGEPSFGQEVVKAAKNVGKVIGSSGYGLLHGMNLVNQLQEALDVGDQHKAEMIGRLISATGSAADLASNFTPEIWRHGLRQYLSPLAMIGAGAADVAKGYGEVSQARQPGESQADYEKRTTTGAMRMPSAVVRTAIGMINPLAGFAMMAPPLSPEYAMAHPEQARQWAELGIYDNPELTRAGIKSPLSQYERKVGAGRGVINPP
jgi:hypothetical protein